MYVDGCTWIMSPVCLDLLQKLVLYVSSPFTACTIEAHRLHPRDCIPQSLTAYHRASQRTTEPHSVPQSLTAYHRASQRTTKPHSVSQSLTAYHRASQRTTEPHIVQQSLTAYHRASQRTTEPHSVPQSLTAYHRASQSTTVNASGKIINVTFVQCCGPVALQHNPVRIQIKLDSDSTSIEGGTRHNVTIVKYRLVGTGSETR